MSRQEMGNGGWAGRLIQLASLRLHQVYLVSWSSIALACVSPLDAPDSPPATEDQNAPAPGPRRRFPALQYSLQDPTHTAHPHPAESSPQDSLALQRDVNHPAFFIRLWEAKSNNREGKSRKESTKSGRQSTSVRDATAKLEFRGRYLRLLRNGDQIDVGRQLVVDYDRAALLACSAVIQGDIQVTAIRHRQAHEGQPAGDNQLEVGAYSVIGNKAHTSAFNLRDLSALLGAVQELRIQLDTSFDVLSRIAARTTQSSPDTVV